MRRFPIWLATGIAVCLSATLTCGMANRKAPSKSGPIMRQAKVIGGNESSWEDRSRASASPGALRHGESHPAAQSEANATGNPIDPDKGLAVAASSFVSEKEGKHDRGKEKKVKESKKRKHEDEDDDEDDEHEKKLKKGKKRGHSDDDDD